MYDVLDVCRYIINYSNKQGFGISNLKLQKILYFVQAYFLTFTESLEPCFSDAIEAWDFGPVVPRAYYQYKRYGNGDIPTVKTFLNFNDHDFWESQIEIYNENCIGNRKDRDLIAKIVDKFKDYSATELVSLTHKQSPWRNAYIPGQNNEITKESIREYFS